MTALAIIGCIFLILILIILIPVVWYLVEFCIVVFAVWGLVKLVCYLLSQI